MSNASTRLLKARAESVQRRHSISSLPPSDQVKDIQISPKVLLCRHVRPPLHRPERVSSTCVLPEDQPGHDDGEDGCRALHRLRKRHRHIFQAHQAQNHRREPDKCT